MIWNFPIGIANNIFLLILFVNTRLYGDAGLQIVYAALGFQGWYNWLLLTLLSRKMERVMVS